MTDHDIPIDKYFEDYGWEYTETDSDGICATVFVTGDDEQYAVLIELLDQYVTFTMPYAVIADEPDAHALVRLLEINSDWSVAKLGLDGDTIVVLIEFTRQGFTYEHFELALDMCVEAATRLNEDAILTEAMGVEDGEG